MDRGFRDAMRAACAPAHKQIALTLWPDLSVDQATTKLSRCLSGDLQMPWALVAVALRGPNPHPIREWFRAQEAPPGEARERLRLELVRVAEQLELIREELADADEREQGVA